jgi:predicted NAD-dependent protein-ADP-ribosyltransferase YbiA (DUF1768 family)
MRIVVAKDIIVLIPQTDTDASTVREFTDARAGYVFHAPSCDGRIELHAVASREVACREPINVVSTSSDERVQLVSNFAETRFVLDGRSYASVEAFWQSIKFPDEADRAAVRGLSGSAAKRAGAAAPAADAIEYEGKRIRVGTHEHWALMERACWAKFSQHGAARDALLSTSGRPLEHRVRRDSKTIPGVIMADIWMRIRGRLTA